MCVNFFAQSFYGICSLFIFYLKLLFRKCATYVLGSLVIKICLLTGCYQAFFVPVSRIVFNRSNGLTVKCLITCLMN